MVFSLTRMNHSTDSVPFWHHSNYRPAKNVLLLCTKTKVTGDCLFPGWYPPRIPEMASSGSDRRNYRVLESLRVRLVPCALALTYSQTKSLPAISSQSFSLSYDNCLG